MKRHFLFMSALASLLISGCAQEKIAPDSPNDGKTETHYMTVNLVSSDDQGTRADFTGYENGTEAESKVSKVRFYFFTANGEAANVKLNGGSYVNYYDWTPGSQSDGVVGGNVESKLAATLVINTAKGDKLPQRIVAVLNYTTELGPSSKSIADLSEIDKDFAASNYTESGNFVMFNSVYAESASTMVRTTLIEAKNLCKSEADALEHPLTIHVERSVAKVRVGLGTEVQTANGGKLALKDKEGENLMVDGKQVYLTLGGWSLTAETNNSRLVKRVNPVWIETMNWWNDALNFRSSWAINSKNAANRYHSYDAIGTAIGTDLYTNENAASYVPESGTSVDLNKTKVILKGTLSTDDNAKVTIVRHLGAYFIDTYGTDPSTNLTNLKKSILAQMKANGYNYYYGGVGSRKQLDVEDLEICPAGQIPEEDTKNNCYVYAKLTAAAAAKTWYNGLDAGAGTVASDDIDKILSGKDGNGKYYIDRALVWRDGMTYYYYEIVHNGTGENSTKGVVRNHIYDTKVTKIAGLGTPVYKPDEEIYPEKPDPNDHYIAATVNILSWRIVSENYELEW